MGEEQLACYIVWSWAKAGCLIWEGIKMWLALRLLWPQAGRANNASRSASGLEESASGVKRRDA